MKRMENDMDIVATVFTAIFWIALIALIPGILLLNQTYVDAEIGRSNCPECDARAKRLQNESNEEKNDD